ncbi:hypothetical protein [Solirubrobacter soli]|uniref:hypothetical protein n=1 Tax=Solirubrobacter soli TaxID=363832 RepID=UPI000416B849|nr:hypothetical protein [Solirubrobacter soli]
MSDNVKSAFKALTPEQQALVKDCRIAGEHSPDEWLRLLGPVAEFDRQSDAVREGGGGFWARRYARKHDVPNGLRWFAVPLTLILREDQDPEKPLALKIDLSGPIQPQKLVNTSDAYKKGSYYKIVDSFYEDTWLEGHAHFADGADVQFSVTDRVRASNKTKRSASGKTKRKVKRKKKTALNVTLSVPARNYTPATGGRDVPKQTVNAGESRTTVKLSGTMEQPTVDHVVPIRMLLELISAAYERVEPARRKKL